jgi:predicted TIM-barrel fold metal-dependent hydrolase
LLYLNNARVIGNLIFSGVLERHPTLKIVSSESGVGWIPFALDALDYQVTETAPNALAALSMNPSEYFRRQIFACFWFEGEGLLDSVRRLGFDNCMFETDFPHPTCLFPDPLTRMAGVLEEVDYGLREKLLSGNAARVYNIDVPT